MQYVSEIDQLLRELQTLPGVKSNSRIDEEQKYKKIFELRDHPQTIPTSNDTTPRKK